MAPLRIEVAGSSTVFRPAERAVLFITVESEGASQTTVSHNVTGASKLIRDRLTSFVGMTANMNVPNDAPITHWSNSSLSTASYFNYDESGQNRNQIHRANMSFEVKFRDFELLSSLATSWSKTKFVSISRIEWRLTDLTRTRLASQCRHQAIQDAVTKAADYAAALGRSAPPVVEVRDSGTGISEYGPIEVRSRRMQVSYGADASRDELDFKPEDVSQSCMVLVVCEERSG